MTQLPKKTSKACLLHIKILYEEKAFLLHGRSTEELDRFFHVPLVSKSFMIVKSQHKRKSKSSTIC